MALDKTNSTCPVRAAQAIIGYLATIPALAAVQMRRDDDPREAPFPRIVAGCFNFREAWPRSDEMEGELRVTYISGMDDAEDDCISARDSDLAANQAAHHAIAAAIFGALRNSGAIAALVNCGNPTRPVSDFHFYGLTDAQQNNERGDRARWQTDFMWRITCAERDYAR